MKNYLFLFVALVSVTFFQCNSDDIADLDVVFEAKFGDQILAYGQEYEQVDGKKFTITRSDFFISDIKLIKDDGTADVLSDVEQVDFENSPGGVKFDFGEISTDNYESIQFNLGLTEEQNKLQPEDFPSDSPLNNSGYYWLGWDSYIFSKVEGKVEGSDGELNEGWIFHTGTDNLRRQVTLPIDRVFTEEDNEIRISLDHRPLFIKDGAAVELGITHDPNDLEKLGTFTDRMASSFSVE